MPPNKAAPGPDTIIIRPLTDAIELEALYRFRYAIYVEEMRRPQLWADHGRKRIEDMLDRACVNIAACLNGAIVGAVRVNLGCDAGFGSYEQLYDMQSVGVDHPEHTAICTRLMLCPEFRGSTLAVRLAAACYRLGLERGVRWTFIDCNAHLMAFFESLGYRRYRGDVRHPEYGMVTPLRFDCQDEAHLRAVKSPLLHILSAFARREEGCTGAQNTSVGKRSL